MLTKEDLRVCNTAPNIRDVSLELYKEFAEEYLMDKVFHYTFFDGTDLTLEITEWGIYHMLGIQHINGKIGGDTFFKKISDGLSFKDFEQKQSMSNRFKKMKKRITMFACVYNCFLSPFRKRKWNCKCADGLYHMSLSQMRKSSLDYHAFVKLKFRRQL